MTAPFSRAGYDVTVIMQRRYVTRLGVQIVPANGSSSELSSHQVAIRSHHGVQKMPASGISSELSTHHMAPAGAIAHSWHHLCPRASYPSFSTLVSPLRPLGLGLLGRCDPRSFIFFYDVTEAGPASHRVRLWQGGPASILTSYGYAPLVPSGVEGIRPDGG